MDLLAWVVEPWKGWEEGRFSFCQLEGIGAEYPHPEQCAPTSLIFRKRPFNETVSRDGFVLVVSSGVSENLHSPSPANGKHGSKHEEMSQTKLTNKKQGNLD